MADDPLSEYRAKRDFASTPEPDGGLERLADEPIYVIQKHDASRLHYDLRLAVDGVLVSWAVPKGPSLDPSVKRLAVMTEDHPLEYAGFEGVIPAGEYGGGTVLVWDAGFYRNLMAEKGDEWTMRRCLEEGHVEVRLEGRKLHGDFALIKTRRGRRDWLLIKMKGAGADPGRDVVADEPDSVLTGRSLEDIAREG